MGKSPESSNEQPTPPSTSREHGPEAPGAREPPNIQQRPPPRQRGPSHPQATTAKRAGQEPRQDIQPCTPGPTGAHIPGTAVTTSRGQQGAVTPALHNRVPQRPRLSKPQTQDQLYTHTHTHTHTEVLYSYIHVSHTLMHTQTELMWASRYQHRASSIPGKQPTQPRTTGQFLPQAGCMKLGCEEERQLIQSPSTGAVIGAVLGALIFICIIIGSIFFIRNRQEDGEGPPKHKPPPPMKAGSSTEMLNKPSEPPTATETAPLSPGEVYYEPTGGEPVTNLDDETTGALNGRAPPVKYDNEHKDHAADGHHGNDLDSSNHEAPTANISRGESFVSPAMYV